MSGLVSDGRFIALKAVYDGVNVYGIGWLEVCGGEKDVMEEVGELEDVLHSTAGFDEAE